MIEEKSITRKKLREKMAEDWCFADFEEYYGYSEEELKAEIRKMYKDQAYARKLIKEIEQKAKHKDKKSQASRKTQSAPESVQEPIEKNQQQDVRNEENGDEMREQLRSEVLKEREAKLAAEIDALRAEINKVNKKLTKAKQGLNSTSKEIAELEEQLAAKQAKAQEQRTNIASFEDQVRENEQKEQELKAELKTVQDEIVKLLTVTLAISEDGVTLWEAAVTFVMDDDGWDELLCDIRDDRRYNFRRTEYENLARAIRIAKNSANRYGPTVDIVSDIEGMEEAFNELLGEVLLSEVKDD